MAKARVQAQKGLYNSSLTRVYPFFGKLIEQDPRGLSWLPALLKRALEKSPLPFLLPQDIGSLLPEVISLRTISGNVLKYHGLDSIELPNCFEKSVPPSYQFLRWLIQNPERLTWPIKRGKGEYKFSDQAQLIREELVGRHGPKKQTDAQHKALNELEEKGARRAHGKWWSFEGTTSVDCFLETEHLVLLIEGKRTEQLSSSVHWYDGRNQLVRNLEVAQELAGNKHFGVLVVAEEEMTPLTSDVFDASLPHFSIEERESLKEHYLGCLTWREVCIATGVPFESLPDTVPEWIASLDEQNAVT